MTVPQGRAAVSDASEIAPRVPYPVKVAPLPSGSKQTTRKAASTSCASVLVGKVTVAIVCARRRYR